MEIDKEYGIEHSDPVRDIMNHPPRRIVRWGNTILIILFALFLGFAWMIRYPDVIPAPVEITTENPPVTLVSRISGRINSLYVKDNEIVKAGQLMAVMETAASVSEVRTLKHAVDTTLKPETLLPAILPEFSQLGEIQEFWSAYLKNLSDFNNYVVNDFFGSKISSITEEINEILKYIAAIKVKEKLYSENQVLEARKYQRDSLLYVNGVFSESDLEKSRQSFLKATIDLQQVRIDQSQKSIELAEKRQLLQDYRIKRLEDREKYYSSLNEEFLNLKARLKIWENNYLLISPVNGTVTFTNFWSKNQTVSEGEPVLTIVPDLTGDFVGRMNLKMNRSGKVRAGQTVNLKLSGYPYLEYGMVRGIVKSKSLVPEGDGYIIELTLPSGLVTLYGKNLDFTQKMQGTAEIITDDMRLLQRLVNPMHHLMTRNKRVY